MRGQQKVKGFYYIIFIDYKKGNCDTNIDTALTIAIFFFNRKSVGDQLGIFFFFFLKKRPTRN